MIKTTKHKTEVSQDSKFSPVYLATYKNRKFKLAKFWNGTEYLLSEQIIKNNEIYFDSDTDHEGYTWVNTLGSKKCALQYLQEMVDEEIK